MYIVWEINAGDTEKVINFIGQNKSLLLEDRMNRNIYRKGIVINKDEIINSLLICLLTSQQDSCQDSNIGVVVRKMPFLLNYQFLSEEDDIEGVIREILKINGLTKYFEKIPKYFASNFSYLEVTDWRLLAELEEFLKIDSTKWEERELADSIDRIFKGFGSKQARDFLQSLGLIKYEIPIDFGIMNWMKDIGFPILFSTTALRDKAFYHFISDGIQQLCQKADIYPCLLHAAAFSCYRHQIKL